VTGSEPLQDIRDGETIQGEEREASSSNDGRALHKF